MKDKTRIRDKVVPLRMTSELYNSLARVAEEKGITVSTAGVRLLEKALEEREIEKVA